nr:MAG TPA: hypothetical protein [Caudoviricetes sp.]
MKIIFLIELILLILFIRSNIIILNIYFNCIKK